MFRARAAAGMFLRDEERFVIRMVFKNTPGFCFFFFFFRRWEEWGYRALPSLRCIFNTSEHPDRLEEMHRVLCY